MLGSLSLLEEVVMSDSLGTLRCRQHWLTQHIGDNLMSFVMSMSTMSLTRDMDRVQMFSISTVILSCIICFHIDVTQVQLVHLAT